MLISSSPRFKDRGPGALEGNKMNAPLLRKLETYARLSEDDIAAVRDATASFKWLEARADIVREGEYATDVPLITQGLACRYKLLADGRRQILAYLVPGDLCDLHGFILREMDHSIATLSPCKIVEIPRQTIHQLLERPAVARGLRMSTLVDEATLREWLVNLGRRPAEERLAHLFCELLERLRAVGLAEEDRFELPVTQIDLADTVGLSAVHLNRTLRALRTANLVMFQQFRVAIPDAERLRQFSGFNPNYLHLREREAAA